jgi:hypothetical protein
VSTDDEPLELASAREINDFRVLLDRVKAMTHDEFGEFLRPLAEEDAEASRVFRETMADLEMLLDELDLVEFQRARLDRQREACRGAWRTRVNTSDAYVRTLFVKTCADNGETSGLILGGIDGDRYLPPEDES